MVVPIRAYTCAEKIRHPREHTCELQQIACLEITLKQFSEPFVTL